MGVFREKRKEFLLILVLFLTPCLIILFLLFSYVFTRDSILSENLNSNENGDFRYKYISSDSTSTKIGIVALSSELEEAETGPVVFQNGPNSVNLISKLENGENIDYKCTGICYCDNSNDRKSLSIPSRSLLYLVSSVSTVLAFRSAKNYFEKECEEYYFSNSHGDEGRCDSIRSEVDKCNPVALNKNLEDEEEKEELNMFEEDGEFSELWEEIQLKIYDHCADKLVNEPPKDPSDEKYKKHPYGEHTVTFECEVGGMGLMLDYYMFREVADEDTPCKVNPHYENHPLVVEFYEKYGVTICDEAFTGGSDDVHVDCRYLYDDECKERAREKYLDLMVEPLCRLYRIVDVGNGWKKVSLCEGLLDNIVCEDVTKRDPNYVTPFERPLYIPCEEDKLKL